MLPLQYQGTALTFAAALRLSSLHQCHHYGAIKLGCYQAAGLRGFKRQPDSQDRGSPLWCFQMWLLSTLSLLSRKALELGPTVDCTDRPSRKGGWQQDSRPSRDSCPDLLI